MLKKKVSNLFFTRSKLFILTSFPVSIHEISIKQFVMKEKFDWVDEWNASLKACDSMVLRDNFFKETIGNTLSISVPFLRVFFWRL